MRVCFDEYEKSIKMKLNFFARAFIALRVAFKKLKCKDVLKIHQIIRQTFSLVVYKNRLKFILKASIIRFYFKEANNKL